MNAYPLVATSGTAVRKERRTTKQPCSDKSCASLNARSSATLVRWGPVLEVELVGISLEFPLLARLRRFRFESLQAGRYGVQGGL